jgi:hypothetical protein
MKYLIQKTLYGRFNYWLGQDKRTWHGLRDNAGRFDEREGNSLINKTLLKRNEEIKLIHSYRENGKILEG